MNFSQVNSFRYFADNKLIIDQKISNHVLFRLILPKCELFRLILPI